MFQAPIMIYPSGSRVACGESGTTCLQTLKSNLSSFDHMESPDRLQIFNDRSLAPKQVLLIHGERIGKRLIIPIEGALQVRNVGLTHHVEVGSMASVTVDAGSTIHIRNPYSLSTVNFLEVHLGEAAARRESNAGAFELLTFDIVNTPNALIPVPIGVEWGNIYFARYEERVDGSLPIDNGHKVFAFVIDGICEIHCRLLESRDGLSMADCTTVEFESLTPQSVLLFMTYH